MSKRTFTVRASFPVQGADLVETVETGNWTAALGMAARLMKRRMKGSRIRAASFTIEQVKSGSETGASVQEQQGALPIEASGLAAPAERGAELAPPAEQAAAAETPVEE